MSTHRKIEWSLFILGLAGLLLVNGEGIVETILLAVATVFAGLHVFHFYDGKKANTVVFGSALVLVVYTLYTAVMAPHYSTYPALSVGVLLSFLALRLRRDFH